VILRIVRYANSFSIEGSFPRGRLSKWFFGEPVWHWINSYPTLEDAKRAKAVLEGGPVEVGEVVG